MAKFPAYAAAWFRAGWFVLAALLVVSPWVALIVAMLEVPVAQWPSLAWPMGGRLRLLASSVALAGASAVLATAVGFVVAMGTWQVPRVMRAGLVWSLLAFASVPPYIHALVWSRTARLSGWSGALWVQAAWFGPLAIAFCVAALGSVDASAFDAARMHVPAWRAFVRVVLPHCQPFLLASAAVCFAIALLDFTVPSLFNLQVYALDLFAELGATESYGRVVWMTLPLVAASAASVALLWRGLRTLPRARTRGAPSRFDWPWWTWPFRSAAWMCALAWLLFPLVSLVAMTGSLDQLLASVRGGYRELSTTATVAPWAAALSVLVGFPWSREMARDGLRGLLAWGALWVPLALPPSVLGVGLIEVWNRPAFDVVTQSEAVLVLTSVQRYAPCAALVLWATERQRDRTLIDAMRVHQRGAWHGWLHVGLRLSWAGWIAAGALAFALSTGELGASLLVAPPGHGTLTMRMYNYLHAGAAEAMAGTALVLWAWTLGAGLLGYLALRRGMTVGGTP